MGAFQVVDERIKDLKEPAEPQEQVSPEDQERYIARYNDYQRKLDQCRYGPLTSKQFQQLVEDHTHPIPTITVAEIEDRSKGDGLLKLVAILQSLWFITQCIVRGKRLALTQLEVVTLAIVTLNVAASAFWWRKPLGVEEPVNVFVRATLFHEQEELAGNRFEPVTHEATPEVLQEPVNIVRVTPVHEQEELGNRFEPVTRGNEATPGALQEPVDAFVRPTLVREQEELTRNRFEPVTRGSDYEATPEGDVTSRHVIHGTAVKVTEAIQFIFDPLRYRPDLSLASSLGLYAVRLPYRLIFVLTYPIFLVFPFAILFLLWATREKRQRVQDRNTVVIRLLLALCGSPYKLTFSIRKYFGNDDGPLGKISLPEYYRSYQHPSFILNWFFVVPASFFLLVFLLLVLSPLFAVSFIASFILTVDLEFNPPNIIRHRATHVPTFYAPHVERLPHFRKLTFALCCVISVVIQFLAQSFSVPKLRLFSWLLLAMSFIPVLNVVPALLYPKPGDGVKDIYMVVVTLYVFTKISFIVLALVWLTQQPAAIDWTNYIPHLSL